MQMARLRFGMFRYSYVLALLVSSPCLFLWREGCHRLGLAIPPASCNQFDQEPYLHGRRRSQELQLEQALRAMPLRVQWVKHVSGVMCSAWLLHTLFFP